MAARISLWVGVRSDGEVWRSHALLQAFCEHVTYAPTGPSPWPDPAPRPHQSQARPSVAARLPTTSALSDLTRATRMRRKGRRGLIIGNQNTSPDFTAQNEMSSDLLNILKQNILKL